MSISQTGESAMEGSYMSKVNGITDVSAKAHLPHTIDEFIRQLGADKDQVPLLAYPEIEQGVSRSREFTGKDLDRFVDAAAKYFIELGLGPVYEHSVVTIFAISNLDYLVSLLGLGRLGYAVLLLSPRLSPEACVALLREMDSRVLIYAPRLLATCSQIQQRESVKIIPLLSRQDYDTHTTEPRFARQVDGPVEGSREIFILHSSGSTGLPKPLHYTHHKLLLALAHPLGGMKAFSTLPYYHTHGLVAPFMNWNKRKVIHLWDSTVPQTHKSVTAALELARPEAVYTVPYILKLLVEKQRGVDLLKACRMVSFSGSSCPDELGDMLVSHGVHLGSIYGSTECGMLFSSLTRPNGDNAWNYLRVSPHVIPYLYMKSAGNNIYECVILDGFQNKIVSNSNDPPNSFHSKDLFTPHPTIPNAWKFFGRTDDRVNLLNGEKVLPLSIEGRIRQNSLVREAIVFGNGKHVPGLLLFRAKIAAELSDKEFIDQVWPTIQDANSRAEGFSQISKNMIVCLPSTIGYPATDKGSIKRAQAYMEFEGVIQLAYDNLNSGGDGDLKLDVATLEGFIKTAFQEQLGISLATLETDFYAAGVDSLKAIQMRGIIRKSLKLGPKGAELDPMVVFNCVNTARLARHLYAMQAGEDSEHEDDIEIMSDLIKKYSVFERHVPGSAPMPSTHKVILTGATGGVGAHILAQLLDTDNVSTVYCLVRAAPTERPLDRLLNALRAQSLSRSKAFENKVVVLACNFNQENLGLEAEMSETMRNHVSLIIHSAWTVNFILGVRSFEDYHIKGIYNLLKFSLSVKTPQPARFFFCSSISAAMATPTPSTVPEIIIDNLAYAASIGYARAKLVGEQIVHNAAVTAGALGRVLRIGQIVGDSNLGLWNESEATPLMIRSALQLKALPALNEVCSWLPVDTVAAIVLDLSGVLDSEIPARREGDRALAYNLVNPHPFSWTKDVLPALRAAGLEFETIPFADWLARMRANDQDPERNPSVKLISFWEHQLLNAKQEQGDLIFETKVTREDSMALRNAPRIVEDRYVEKFVKIWLQRWT